MCNLGIKITGGAVGTTLMGDGSNGINSSNVLDDYSVIYVNGTEQVNKILFSCTTGLGPIASGLNTNDGIGDLYYNNISLTNGTCNGFVKAIGAKNMILRPGVLNIKTCGNITTSTEGIYTCRLMNSSMMYQSVSVGVYFSGRSESFYNT